MFYHIQYEDGSNPYICKTEAEFKKIQKKYGDRLERLKDGYFVVKAEEKDDFFSPGEESRRRFGRGIRESQTMKLNTNYSQIKSDVIKQIQRAFDDQDYQSTYYVPLGTAGKNRWAIVIAWMDYDNNDNWEVFGKVAYQPTNSIMQEYDIDWTMPYDEETGEVYDTETSIPQALISQQAAWLTDQWKDIVKDIETQDMEESGCRSGKYLREDIGVNESLILEYLIEGCTLTEAMYLAENKITPEMIDKIEQTPAYRKLQNDIKFYFKAVDGIAGYRDKEFAADPIGALNGEADFCQDVADFLGEIEFQGFSPEDKKKLVSDTIDDMEYLDTSALRLKNILKKQDNSKYLNSDGTVNKKTSLKPGEYARRALRGLRNLFKRLGREWDYDPDFDYSSLPDVDYSMYVKDSKRRRSHRFMVENRRRRGGRRG